MSTSTQETRTDSRNGTAANEAQIRAIVEDWAEAHRVKDARRAVSHVAAGDVQFTMAPPLQYTGANARGEKAMAEWFSGFEGPMGFEIRELTITTSENAAFCHFLNRLSATARNKGPFAMWNRVTLGFRKLEGRWLITHLHSSVPFYMDVAFRAAVDLQP